MGRSDRAGARPCWREARGNRGTHRLAPSEVGPKRCHPHPPHAADPQFRRSPGAGERCERQPHGQWVGPTPRPAATVVSGRRHRWRTVRRSLAQVTNCRAGIDPRVPARPGGGGTASQGLGWRAFGHRCSSGRFVRFAECGSRLNAQEGCNAARGLSAARKGHQALRHPSGAHPVRPVRRIRRQYRAEGVSYGGRGGLASAASVTGRSRGRVARAGGN